MFFGASTTRDPHPHTKHLRVKRSPHAISSLDLIYQRATHQSSWSARPHHVSFSGTLWLDLTMVGVLYRLDEFFLSYALATQNAAAMWIPVAVFVALFDAWECRMLLDAEFRLERPSSVHYVWFLIMWLLIAMMATTFPTVKFLKGYDVNGTTPIPTGVNLTVEGFWSVDDAATFAALKCAHAVMRVVCYADIYVMTTSLKAKHAALPRLITYALGAIPLVIAPVIILEKAATVPQAASCFVVSFVFQKLIWWSLGFFDWGGIKTRASKIRVNVPFVIQRMKDWTELQLGGCILGIITFGLSLDSAPNNYTVVFVGYTLVAAINLLSSSTDPQRFSDHALVLGGMASTLFFDSIIVSGISLLGVQVGLRYAVQYLYFDKITQSSNDFLTWILSAGVTGTILTLLFQEVQHNTKYVLLTRKRVWSTKVVFACSALISSCMMTLINGFTKDWPLYATVNTACSALVVLIIHALNGGFRREIAKKDFTKLQGHVLAAVIAKAWLARARERLILRGTKVAILSEITVAQPKKVYVVHVDANPELNEDDLHEHTASEDEDDDAHNEVTYSQSRPEWDGSNSFQNHSYLDEASHTGSSSTIGRQHHTQAPRILKSLLYANFYERPNVLPDMDVFAEFKINSYVMLDVSFIGILYRLGEYLQTGIGLGYTAETHTSVSYPIWLFCTLFLGTFSMWLAKLGFASKCSVNDVFHKVLDLLQGFFVVLCAINITDPQEMMKDSRYRSYIVGASIGGFHFITMLTWIEVFTQKSVVAKDCARRNILRSALSIGSMFVTFITLRASAPYELTSFFWAGAWLFPFIQRVLSSYGDEISKAPFLLRFVLHRTGDALLIWLGEGVLQVIRALSGSNVSDESYGIFFLSFLILNCARIVIFRFDVFDTHAEKHAILKSRYGSLLVYFIRSLSAPAIVSMGVALKLIIDKQITNQDLNETVCSPYLIELFCISELSTMWFSACIYHVHRYVHYESFRTFHFLVECMISLLFLIFPWIPCLSPFAVLIGSLVIWAIMLSFNAMTDDFLSSRPDHASTSIAYSVMKKSFKVKASTQPLLQPRTPNYPHTLTKFKSLGAIPVHVASSRNLLEEMIFDQGVLDVEGKPGRMSPIRQTKPPSSRDLLRGISRQILFAGVPEKIIEEQVLPEEKDVIRDLTIISNAKEENVNKDLTIT